MYYNIQSKIYEIPLLNSTSELNVPSWEYNNTQHLVNLYIAPLGLTLNWNS